MRILYTLHDNFFEGTLDGTKIPILLHMVEQCQNDKFVTIDEKLFKIEIKISSNLDEIFGSICFTENHENEDYDIILMQKNVEAPRSEVVGKEIHYMLNDSYTRQNLNRIYELFSGVYGFDLFRLKSILKLPFSFYEDVRVFQRADIVFVQTKQERAFLRKMQFNECKIKIYNNARQEQTLINDDVSADLKKRVNKFLITVPNAKNRIKEVINFIKFLNYNNVDLSNVVLMGDLNNRKKFPNNIQYLESVENYSELMSTYQYVLVPTKHFTGFNNRVYQALKYGANVIATKQALDGFSLDYNKDRLEIRRWIDFVDAFKNPKTYAVSWKEVRL